MPISIKFHLEFSIINVKRKGIGSNSKGVNGVMIFITDHTLYPTALSSSTFIYPSNCSLLLLLRIPKSKLDEKRTKMTSLKKLKKNTQYGVLLMEQA